MKLSAWAKKQGISYTTAWRWFRDGRLPVRAEQMATGTVIVHDEEAPAAAAVALYSACFQSRAKGPAHGPARAPVGICLARKTDLVALCRRNRIGLEWPSPKNS
jgi:putative resolvase